MQTRFLERYENCSDEQILENQDFIISTVLKLVINGFKELDINLLFLVRSVKVVWNNNTFLKEFADNVFGGGVDRYLKWSEAN